MDTIVNGLDVHYEIGGSPDAPPLLCLHSLATDNAVWDAQVPALEAHFRVVRPDLRGHGATAATPPPYDLDLLRDDAVGLLDALGIERVSVLGLSIGAIIALGLALDAPERVERIVVADCRADAPDAYKAIWDGAIATIDEHGLAPVIDSSVQRWFSEKFRAAEPATVAAVRDRAMGTAVDGFVGIARAVQQLDYLRRLDDIAVPALFVVGTEDPAAPPAVMAEMAARVPGARLVELDGAGHLTPVECGDRFTDAVVPFLRGE